MISFEDFAKVEMKTGKILSAEPVEGSEKLIRLKVDIGEDKPRNIFAGIVKWYTPEDLIGKNVIIVANLEPRRMMNEYSEGMLLAADGEKPIPLTTSEPVEPGAKIR
jgi:methionine--tRNA ligase beta chain